MTTTFTLDELLVDLTTQRFSWIAQSDNGDILLTIWRGSKDGCEPDTVMPTKFYGLTLTDAVSHAHDILSDPNESALPRRHRRHADQTPAKETT